MKDRYVPEYKVTEILADADQEEESGWSSLKYLAFPSILKLDETRLLICCHRGEKHAWSKGVVEGILYSKTEKRVVSRSVLDDTKDVNDQNVELAGMPNGDIVCYIDRQAVSNEVIRLGVKQLRSEDRGVTWRELSGLVDNTGIEYGYVYDSLTIGNTVYMLALTVPELENRGSGRSVHVIKSHDNGVTWIHVKNLKDALGYSCDDECGFAEYQEGFLLVCRGRDWITRAFITDADFNPVRQRNLTADFSCIDHLCRPYLFVEDGKYWLMGRNVRKDKSMELALYQFDAANLSPVTHVQLELDQKGQWIDGFYAEAYMQMQDGEKYFNVITYWAAYSEHPDILRLEYKWEEIRNAGARK